jgi:dihydropteroate synthase
MLGEPRTMQDRPHYDDVVREVGDALVERLDAARRAGIDNEALAADPGIGFGKTRDHNLELLARVSELSDRVQVPLVVGASRKTFLGVVLRDAGVEPVDQRDDATLATVMWVIDQGAAVVRVHDARRASQAVALWDALHRAVA